MRSSSHATRLDTQTSDDVEFIGGIMDGVAIGDVDPTRGRFTSVSIGSYQIFVDEDGSLKIRAADGTLATLVVKT